MGRRSTTLAEEDEEHHQKLSQCRKQHAGLRQDNSRLFSENDTTACVKCVPSSRSRDPIAIFARRFFRRSGFRLSKYELSRVSTPRIIALGVLPRCIFQLIIATDDCVQRVPAFSRVYAQSRNPTSPQKRSHSRERLLHEIHFFRIPHTSSYFAHTPVGRRAACPLTCTERPHCVIKQLGSGVT